MRQPSDTALHGQEALPTEPWRLYSCSRPRRRGALPWAHQVRSVRREAIEQSVTAGALQVGLRAAAVWTARGVRGVPGFRGVVVAQAHAVGMTDHRRALCRARPVLAGTILSGRKRCPVRLRSRQHVVAVGRIAAAVDDLALFAERGL